MRSNTFNQKIFGVLTIKDNNEQTFNYKQLDIVHKKGDNEKK